MTQEHKSLASIIKKNIPLYQRSFNRNTNEKTKITLFYVMFF